MRKSKIQEKKPIVKQLVYSSTAFILCFMISGGYTWGLDQKAEKYDSIIRTIAGRYSIDPQLVHSIIRAESNYNPQAVSSKGAIGLMQLMPPTAKAYGVKDLYDPIENIEGGIKYLRDLIKTYNQDHELILAAYNAGPESVKKYKGVPPYPETVAYIQKVKTYWGKETSGRKKTAVYRFRDESGRLVLTNDKNYYLMNKKK